MKLQYDVIEDVFDDTTQIRTLTEHATLGKGRWLLRTTLYTPHQLSMSVVVIKNRSKRKKPFAPLA
jgi:hypothetical protein